MYGYAENQWHICRAAIGATVYIFDIIMPEHDDQRDRIVPDDELDGEPLGWGAVESSDADFQCAQVY